MATRPHPLFIDTGAFFARYNERATEYERTTAVFQGIRSGDLPYNPLFTSRYVLSELATLMLRKVGHQPAVNALTDIQESTSINVLPVTEGVFDRICEQFGKYNDQQISFVDHSSAVLASNRDIEHVFAFDRDDFQTLGFTVVPADTGDA